MGGWTRVMPIKVPPCTTPCPLNSISVHPGMTMTKYNIFIKCLKFYAFIWLPMDFSGDFILINRCSSNGLLVDFFSGI